MEEEELGGGDVWRGKGLSFGLRIWGRCRGCGSAGGGRRSDRRGRANASRPLATSRSIILRITS